MLLIDGLRTKKLRQSSKSSEPLWKGPEQDGITFSLLSRFLACRERFRLLVVKGLKSTPRFNHRIEYGSMWHVCEEAHAKGLDLVTTSMALQAYCQELCQKYPLQREEIRHWGLVCSVQFPLYVEHWSKHPDVLDRTPLLQEQVFEVPYKLPSGRTVKLRGKWDSVDLIGKGKLAGIYLQENKTKGEIVEKQLKQQLTFDLQTMTYMVALESGNYAYQSDKLVKPGRYPLLGVRYNVVRRPLSGGKGSIVQHKATAGAKCLKCKGTGVVKSDSVVRNAYGCPKCSGKGRIGGKPAETEEAFYGRLSAIIKGSPEEYFMRWKVEVSAADIQRFKRECLDPILEQLCQWWELVSTEPFSKNPFVGQQCWHWRHPYGCYNPLNEGGSSELDEYLATGSESGLARTNDLFPELSCPQCLSG